jgi:hypothetical protein
MSAARFVGAGGSLLIHAVLLVALNLAIHDSGGGIEIPVRPLADNALERVRMLGASDAGSNGDPCPNTYYGVGAKTSISGRGTTVLLVSPGGPADLAGLRVGDEWLNAAMFERDGYSPGRLLVLRVERDGRRFDLPVRIGRVCYERVST